jgi:hypothetical protein
MSISIRSPKPAIKTVDAPEYLQAFREQVFKLIKMGYDRLDSKEYKDSEEPDISGELVSKMREIAQNSTGLRWAAHFSIHDDPPINELKRLGKKRRRLDIELVRTRYGPHPRYPFEAKRLSGRYFTTGKYLGQKGLKEFTTGHYAADLDEAGMLGYIQSDSLQKWADKLHRQFEKDSMSLQACPDGKWTNTEVIPELNHCYRSKHNRPTVGKPITLYHILLNFC